MKTLYLECKMGAAGDMLTASLLELLPDKQAFIDKMNSLGIPGLEISYETMSKCGINGTHMSVKINGMDEHEYFKALRHAHGDHSNHTHKSEHEHSHEHEHAHTHTHSHDHIHEHSHEHSHDHETGAVHTHSHSHAEHEHHHEHSHHHTGMHEIRHIIEDMNISDKVRADVLAVYELIAEAESHAHGVPVEEIHFHEVGSMDAVADITGVCLLIEELAPERIIASPVHVGSGHVHCLHGTLPVPAPATAHILTGIPTYSDGSAQGELCTPTGAALLKHFVNEFCEMPVMTISKIGYGMGTKDFKQANCVRAMLGESGGASSGSATMTAEDLGCEHDNVIELVCNIDDMTPEAVGFAVGALFDEGALDVWTESIGMKKNRPGIKLCCLCRPADRESVIRAVFKHTTTIGIRKHECFRYMLSRRESVIETPYGAVRSKISSGCGVEREKPEFDDLAVVAKANGISIKDVIK